MKKLLFTFVGAASFAALAADPAVGDNITVLGFENFSATDVGVLEKDDSGQAGTSLWSATGDDASLVKAYGVGDNATAPTGISFPAPFTDAGNNYLALDTNGSELQRAIPAAGQTIAADGTYVDTLVQFTPSESEPGDGDLTGAKLAIWLGVSTNAVPTTNLYVKAGAIASDGTLTAHSYKLNGTAVPGQWYRLTVTALKNIMAKPAALMEDEGYLNGFQIKLDGTLLEAADDTVFDEDYITETVLDANWGWLEAERDAATVALLRSNTVFPSLAGMDEMSATLTAVGFKGTGAIDDFVVTTAAPEFGGNDYVVSIDGSDVVVTPSAEDLAAVQAAVIVGGGTLDVTDVAAVNAALAAPIGTTGIPSWQALFLGLPPTEAGLESFKIDSISIGADGKVTVALPASVDPKTGRGVAITLKLKAADTPNAAPADWTDVESASGTTFAPFAPGSTDTKKFYKVVVEFAGSSASASQE